MYDYLANKDYYYYCGLSESRLCCVFSKLYPVGFLVVCKCLSRLLLYIVMPYLDCGDDG